MWRNNFDEETGAEALMEVVARYATSVPSQNIDAVIEPDILKAEDLDWAFFEFEPVRDERLKSKGFVARILNYLLGKDGSLSALSDGTSVPPSLLQHMVQQGKGVVAIAEGIEGAKAIMTEYKLRTKGRALFNFLVTDEVCASEILRQFNHRVADIPHRRDWWIKRHTFLSAFLRYNAKQTNNEIARLLSLSVKQVKRLLEHAAQGSVEVDPILSFQVRPPSLEMALEVALLKNWSLMEVRVVPTLGGVEGNLRLVGEAGADLLASLLRRQETFTVGFGGGRAIKAVAEALDLNRLLQDLPLLRRLRICILERNPLPKVLGVTAETILSPLLSPIDDRVVLCRYNGTTNEPKLDAVFVSIGSLNYPDSIHAFVHEEELNIAKDSLAGLILFQFITWDGQILPTHWARELGFMPLSELQRMVREGKPVVIVAYGAHKADAILAAYKMGLFNCLVVDRVLAEALLARSQHALPSP
ncbi:sugar-binding domain-containing protein [Fervidibacter sacchari]